MDDQLQPQNTESSGTARRDRRLIAPAAFVAALVGGGLAGSVIGAPTISQALQSDETTTTTADDTSTTDPSSESSDPGDDGARECGPGRPWLGRFGGLAAAAEVLGVTEDELRESLRDGSSLADVAEAEGVDVQTVIDALVEVATTEIDERVAAGTLDEERATELEADLVERITARVNGEGGFFGHGPSGPRGPGEPPEDEDAATTTQPEGS